MKYLLSILVIMLGAFVNQYVPADWQYTWGYLVGIIVMAIMNFFDY